MTPHDTATSGTSTSQTTTESSPNFAQLAMQGLQTAGNLWAASDEKVKKNISNLGVDPATGV